MLITYKSNFSTNFAAKIVFGSSLYRLSTALAYSWQISSEDSSNFAHFALMFINKENPFNGSLFPYAIEIRFQGKRVKLSI